MLTALRNPELWTPGTSSARAIAVRVGPFVERAHTRPGDDHGPDLIAVTLVHPDTSHAGAYLHGRKLGCPPQYEFADHPHICLVCRGENYQPEWFAEERVTELDRRLATSLGHGPGLALRYRRLAQSFRKRR